MSENGNNSDNMQNQNPQEETQHKNARMEYCAICHRSSADAGPMVHIPNGMPVCSDCMQKMMNMAASFDYSRLMSDPSVMQEFNDMMLRTIGGLTGQNPGNNAPQGTGSDKAASSQTTGTGMGSQAADHSSAKDTEGSAEKSGSETSASEQAADGEDNQDDGQHDKKEDGKGPKGPSISFLNLGDLFGGMGGPQQRPKTHRRTRRTKPVFSIDNMPAPHILKAKLDEYVVGQDEAKKVLSVAVYNHYKRVKTGHMDDIDIEKSNILMIGPPGCGKTYLVKTLAELLDVPLAITDATSLTEAGYIGDDIESVISKLLDAADNDVERTEKGIVFIDEIDKIAKKSTTTSRDVNGESVQQGMLKLLEGAEVEVPVGASSKNAMVPMQLIDTRNILFICGGAFPTLPDIIKDRLTKQSGFGYNAELKDRYDDDKNILSHVTTEDLRKFGFIPEFIGRLPIICTLQGLSRDAMDKILTEPRNAILKQYQKLLAIDGVDLEFDQGAVDAIAEQAMKKETGARALRSIIEEYMLDIMYEVPKDPQIGKITITRDYIERKGVPIIELKSTETPAIPAETSSAAPEETGGIQTV